MKLTKRSLALVLALLGIVLPAATAAAANCRAGAPCRISGAPAVCRGSVCCCPPSAPHQGRLGKAARPSDCPGMVQADPGPVAVVTAATGQSPLAVLTAIGDGAPMSRPQPIDSAGPPLLLSNLTLDARSPRAPPSC